MIVDIGKIHVVFNNAHRALLDKYGTPKSGDHWQKTCAMWEQEYDVRLISDVNWARVDRLEFKSEEDMTMFLLKWSS